jgi:two-component system sensor histidine kinase KdpD
VLDWRGTKFEDMDTDAVIARHPQIAVVDEFAHTNVPGSERPKRWQDVVKILDAGIDVLTSLNIQHIESLNDQVWHVTGVRVRETIPDWVLQEADEVVMVDVTPRALVHRLERGVVYAPEKAAQALSNFFTESNLTALRELAMRETAQHLEEPAQPRVSGSDKILLWVTPHPASAMLIRRGRRVADYLNAECTAVILDKDAEASAQHMVFCRSLRIDTDQVACNGDPAKAISEYARRRGITHLFVTRHAPEIQKLVQISRTLQITIVSERIRDAHAA